MSRFIRLPEVEHRTGYARSSIYRMVQRQDFPAPVKIGARASAWLESEVEAWIEARVSASRPENGTALN